MSQPPPRTLAPITSSTLPNVGAAFSRPSAHSSAPAPQRLPPPTLFEAPDEGEARHAVGYAQLAERAGPKHYTVRELIETARQRRRGVRRVIESGDPDGPVHVNEEWGPL